MPVFDLGLQPLANDFAGPDEAHSGYAPLRVMFCPRCTLAQLSVVVDPEILYRRYSYVTSISETMLDHFQKLMSLLSGETTGTSVLEIGSNDGRLLQYMQSHGMRVCGIDPAQNLCEIANSMNLRTVCGHFNKETARSTQSCFGSFDCVLARHVFCHVDNWREFIESLSEVTHPDSIVGIEVPYCVDMLNRGEFDTIYHEHTSYMTVQAMDALLKGSSFRIYKIVRFPIHGGAIMMLLCHRDSQRSTDESVAAYLKEQVTTQTWSEFSALARTNIEELKKFVSEKVSLGSTVVGFGASAKSTVFINACRFTRTQIRFITDTTPQKQWKLSPGTDIPIVDEGAILRELPDYAVCFAWNFRDEIVAKNTLARSKGVRFVFPIPRLEIV